MEQVLRVGIGRHRAVHVATLSNQAVIENGAGHLGFDGYFIFESCDEPNAKGITVLGKCPSIESALRLAELLEAQISQKRVRHLTPRC